MVVDGEVFNQNWMWRSLDAWVGLKTARHQRKTRPIVKGIVDHGNEEWREYIELAQLKDVAIQTQAPVKCNLSLSSEIKLNACWQTKTSK